MNEMKNSPSFLNECLHDMTIRKQEMDLPQNHSHSFNDSKSTTLFNTGRKRERVEELQENENSDCIDRNFSFCSNLKCDTALAYEDQIDYKQNFGRKMKRRNSKVGQMFFKEDESFQPRIKYGNNSEIMSKRRGSSVGSKNSKDRYGIYCIPEKEEKKDSAPIVSADDIEGIQVEDILNKLILK